jgi:putative DNA primase/helicase
MKTVDRARGRWPEILARCGVDRKFLRRNRHGPCPLCGGRDRYRFTDEHGSGSYFCNQCGASRGHGAGLRLLMKFRGWDFKTAVTEIDRLIGTDYVPPPPTRPEPAPVSPWEALYREWQETMP